MALAPRKQTKALSKRLFGSEHRESSEERLDLAVILRQSDDAELQHYAERLMSPDSMRSSAAALAVSMLIPQSKIASEYEKVQKAKGIIRMAKHVPDIMEEVAVKARSEYVECPVCQGSGTTEIDKMKSICKECRGKKRIDVGGSKEMIKLVFDTMKLTGNAAGPLVNVDLRKMDTAEKMEDLYKTLEGTP